MSKKLVLAAGALAMAVSGSACRKNKDISEDHTHQSEAGSYNNSEQPEFGYYQRVSDLIDLARKQCEAYREREESIRKDIESDEPGCDPDDEDDEVECEALKQKKMTDVITAKTKDEEEKPREDAGKKAQNKTRCEQMIQDNIKGDVEAVMSKKVCEQLMDAAMKDAHYLAGQAEKGINANVDVNLNLKVNK